MEWKSCAQCGALLGLFTRSCIPQCRVCIEKKIEYAREYLRGDGHSLYSHGWWKGHLETLTKLKEKIGEK